MALAASGLGITSLAQAQSKVELFGIVDVNVEAYNNAPDGSGGKQTVTGMRSGGQNGSRWGLRGSEDLGNGVKVIFFLASGFNVATGEARVPGRTFNRQAFVGIQGPWGTVSFGRQNTPSHNAIVHNTPGGFPSQYEPVPYISPINGNNMLMYRGQFKGFGVGAYYGFSDQTAQMADDQAVTGRFGGALTYNYQQRFRVLLGYDRVQDGIFTPSRGLPTASSKGKADNWLFAARSDFGNFYVLGAYRLRKWEMNGLPDVKSNFFTVGGGYRYREGSTISVGYFYDKLKDAPAAMTDNAVRRSSKWQQVNVFGTYALSKRTNLYASVAYAHNGALNLGFGGDGGSYALASGSNKQAGATLGIRHRF